MHVCVSVVHACVPLMELWGCHWDHHSIPDTHRGQDNLGEVTGSERKQEPQPQLSQSPYVPRSRHLVLWPTVDCLNRNPFV